MENSEDPDQLAALGSALFSWEDTSRLIQHDMGEHFQDTHQGF